MSKNNYDIIIIGDGSVGLSLAYNLFKKDNSLKIAVIGNDYKKASTAAGAMHAIFGEIEKNFENSVDEKFIFEMALKSRKKFINFFNENGGNSNFITSKNTLVYLNKNANDFEKENFDSMLKISNMYNIAKDIKDIDKYFPNNIDVKKAVLLKGEFSFNPYSYLNALKKSLNKIEFINEELIEVIKQNKKGVTIKCSSNLMLHRF